MFQFWLCKKRRRPRGSPDSLSDDYEHAQSKLTNSSAWMGAPALLSSEDTQELFLSLMRNAMNWVDEEAQKGEDVDFSSFLTSEAFQCVALHVPTTIRDLKSMGQFDRYMMREYGERIIRCVQLFLEENGLKEVICRESTEENMTENSSTSDWPTLDRKVLPCLFPKHAIMEVELVLEELVTKWVSIERNHKSKNDISLDRISLDALRNIAFHAPTTVEDLKAIGSLRGSIVLEYGERIVLAIQMVLTKSTMQQDMGTKMISSPIKFDEPLTSASSMESSSTMPITPCSSISGASGTVEQRMYEAAQELVDVLKLLANNWAEEERIVNGESVYYWDIMPDKSIKTIASHCPTTMAELQLIWTPKAKFLMEYGPRIVAVVQSVMERYDLNTGEEDGLFLYKVDEGELEMGDGISLQRDKNRGKPSVLPEKLARELYFVLQKVRKSWADEERECSGRTFQDWDILSREALNSISLRAPTTVDHLRKIKAIPEDAVKVYGIRIVAVVQMFLEMKKIRGYSSEGKEAADSSWEVEDILVSPTKVMPAMT